HRSFAVTDEVMLEGFSFARVMNAIVARSGTNTTALQLYQQMLDTQNPKPGLVAPGAPHCDDFIVDGQPAFNSLPRRCPTPEGVLALSDPFTANDYVTLGVFNRFDLTPTDGSNCGQYRVIVAKRHPTDKLHFIFEATLPNPNPSAGVAACRPVAEFWASLSKMDSIADRRAALEKFFYTGIDGFPPVFDPDHYAPGSGGGIRTVEDTVSSGVAERFYQFRLTKSCNAAGCSLIAQPDVLENMPFGRFFDANNDSPEARAFRDEFVKQVPNLAVRDVNLYFMQVPREFLMAESHPLDSELAFAYDVPFGRSLTTPAGQEFASRIDAELKKIGSTLTPQQIIGRAETQTCVGCHVLSGQVGEGVVFPPPLGAGEHMYENSFTPGPDGKRFMISQAMEQVFIPHRMDILEHFLLNGTPPVHSDVTIGGGRAVQ
ncbi:MAG: hypothetical protein ACXVJT_10030, partial [Thermoanaerobaculia bacterium]